MGRIHVLNERSGQPDGAAVDLSQSLLAAARELEDGGDRARVETLSGQLAGIDPAAIEGDDGRIAFWLNVYNALILHRFGTKPVRGNLLLQLGLFDRTAYRVGSGVYPLNLIENGVLRRNSRAPLRLRAPLRGDDPRAAVMPARLDPRIHFALNCGAVSCPRIASYDAEGLDSKLEAATRAYLAAETTLDRDADRVRLPNLIKLYSADFGPQEQQLAFVAARLPELAEWLADPGLAAEGRVRTLRLARRSSGLIRLTARGDCARLA